MWEWSDKLKLGKETVFVKRELRLLPLTDAEFEADFFLDPVFSTNRQEHWKGMVIEIADQLADALEIAPPTL